MAEYTYLAADLLTGRILDEIPMSGVSYTVPINDVGTLKATVPLYSRAGLAETLATGRTALYVDRNGVIVWGGILWGRRYSVASGNLEIDAADFLSYLDHLLITKDLNYRQIDQFAIARGLVDHGMTAGQSNLGMVYLGPGTSGVKRDRNYLAVDNKVIGEALRQLSAVDNGFDFRFGARWEGPQIRRTMTMGYPKLGRALADSRIVWEYDTDATDWTWQEDAAGSANIIYASGVVPEGSADGVQPPRYIADAPEVRAGGMPRLAAALNFDDITQVSTLQAHAKGMLTALRLPLMTSDSSLVEQVFGTFNVGDEVRVRIPAGDALFRDGASVVATVSALDVAVSDEFAETIKATLQPLSVTARSAVTGAVQVFSPDTDWRV